LKPVQIPALLERVLELTSTRSNQQITGSESTLTTFRHSGDGEHLYEAS